MSVYAIGDVQGCQRELLDLLDTVNFDEHRDKLWFVGDLVNRGPDSLATLRFVRNLGEHAVTVLGNHDLHLLAVAYTNAKPKKKDTLAAILTANDREDLLDWLRRQPLLHHDAESGFVLVHAGIAPGWDLHRAKGCAREVREALSGADCQSFLEAMYGNQPDHWQEAHERIDRLRYVVNVFTRMRYCHADGRLALEYKGAPGSQDRRLQPWFEMPTHNHRDHAILFGHWSTLRLEQQDFSAWNVYPLDTGCVWGGRLTAMRLEDKKEFSVPSRQAAAYDG